MRLSCSLPSVLCRVFACISAFPLLLEDLNIADTSLLRLYVHESIFRCHGENQLQPSIKLPLQMIEVALVTSVGGRCLAVTFAGELRNRIQCHSFLKKKRGGEGGRRTGCPWQKC